MATRKKNAEATRDAILNAARVAFTRHGYDGVGVREIAAAAGANPSLVNRYFGSKLALFEEAVPATVSIAALLPDAGTEFRRAVAERILRRPTHDLPGFDPTLAMLRSAGNAEVADLLRHGLEERLVRPLAERLGGADATARGGLIAALLAGVTILRDVIGIAAVSQDEEALRRLTTRLLDVLAEP